MYSYCCGLKLIIQSEEKASKGKTEHVGGLVLIFLLRQNILLWSVYVKYCVFLYGLGVMNEADCVYVGDLKKRKIARYRDEKVQGVKGKLCLYSCLSMFQLLQL